MEEEIFDKVKTNREEYHRHLALAIKYVFGLIKTKVYLELKFN